MKRLLYILTIALGIYSCDDFLDTTPTDFITLNNYYKTEIDVNTALMGVYDVIGKTYTYGRTMYFEQDVADEGFWLRSMGPINDLAYNNYDPSDLKVNNLWTTLYDGIKRANMFLENIDNPDLDMDADKVTVAKGQVIFLRAYYHFLLVSNWGDIPLKLSSTESVKHVNIARTPEKEVYAYIVKDMEKSFQMVRKASEYAHNGLITKSTVAGILARVNMKMAGYPLQDATRWKEARKWASVVINDMDGFHQLNPDYKQIFINHCQDKYDTKECLWEVEFSKGMTGGQEEEGSLGSIVGIPTGDNTIGYSYGSVHVYSAYFKKFEDKDLRRDWTINDYYYDSANGNAKKAYTASQIYNRCNAKWRREYETAKPKNTNTTPINFPILRYSDVLLMFAEADNEITDAPSLEAYEAVNEVRRRGYGLLLPTPPDPDVEADLPPYLDKMDFRMAIQKERTLELGFEALRRFDLIRWGLLLSTMQNLTNDVKQTAPAGIYNTCAIEAPRNTSERHLVFPVPSAEMSLNKLATQNIGW